MDRRKFNNYCCNGLYIDLVDWVIFKNVEDFIIYSQEQANISVFSRSYETKKISPKTVDINVRVNLVRDEKDNWSKVNHTNIDDATINDAVRKILKIVNQNEKNNN